MTTDDLRQNFLEPWTKKIEARLDRIENKLDLANGRSRKNAWNIRAIWTVISCTWGVFLLWLKNKL